MKAGCLAVDEGDAQAIEAEFHRYIADIQFPCVGAKSAQARGRLELLIAHDLRSGWDDLRIHNRLLAWSDAYREEPEGLRSLAVVFQHPKRLSETMFERLLWTRVQSLAEKDHWLGQQYDERVSPDPDDPHFSLSFGGQRSS